MNDFDLSKPEGGMFIECRTDGGISIFVDASANPKAATLPLTKYETIQLTKWLVMYIAMQQDDIGY